MSERVLIVSNAVNGGGAEKSSMELFQQLRKHHENIYFCAINLPSISEVFSNDDDIFQLSRIWGSGLLGVIRVFWDFKSLVKRLCPDTVIANCELPELFTSLLPIKKLRIVAVEHTSRPWYGRLLLGMVVRTVLLFKRAEWVSVSSLKTKIWPYGQSARLIPNPIQISTKAQESAGDLCRKCKPEEKPRLAYVGRLRKEKNARAAIEAAIRCDIALDVFGDGPDLQLLLNITKSHGNLVKFHGFVSNPWQSMHECALVVVPSEFEGDGMVVIEAIANNHCILLSDNEDLRRFQFPAENYFRGQVELEAKINAWKESHYELFRVPLATREGLMQERDIFKIGESWSQLLNLNCSGGG